MAAVATPALSGDEHRSTLLRLYPQDAGFLVQRRDPDQLLAIRSQ